MTVKNYVLFVLVLGFLFSCSSEIDPETYVAYQKKGSEISQKAQATLLRNVADAMQKGGPQNAVEFCNLEASTIVAQLNEEFACTISRVSDKNRNPNNLLKTTQERELWKFFVGNSLSDTVIQANNKMVFYKPIKIAMPACLKCHGNPETDINLATRKKLNELYPKDLATGYQLNDFRGLWKIEFERK